jgi:hypothetical protein
VLAPCSVSRRFCRPCAPSELGDGFTRFYRVPGDASNVVWASLRILGAPRPVQTGARISVCYPSLTPASTTEIALFEDYPTPLPAAGEQASSREHGGLGREGDR